MHNIYSWQDCQTQCQRNYRCEWFTYIDIHNECQLRQSRRNQGGRQRGGRQRGGRQQGGRQRGGRARRNSAAFNLRMVFRARGGEHYTSGSVLAADLSHPNCNCPTANNRYDVGTPRTTTTERSSWSWSWNPCPIGEIQTQAIFGRGMTQCCPVEAGTDGTQVCEY